MRSDIWRRLRVRQGGEGLVFVVLLLVSTVPIYWAVVTSLKEPNEIFRFPPRLGDFTPTTEHYGVIIADGFLRTILNSAIYCGVAMLLGVFVGFLAAYGLQRYDFRFKQVVFYLVVACIPLSIGSAALLIPNYVFMSELGLIDKWYTLAILFTAYNLPMAIWICRSGVESVPIEIEESAMLDGCTRPRIMFRMVFRLMTPSVAAAALFIFIGAWNEFILAAVMMNSKSLMPVQVAIYNYLGFFGQQWGPLTASASLAIIPSLLIFTVLGRMLVSGLTQGAVKG
jgi:ABC-type glycerol-3-phosphate transport system permease component